jgi:hypothetical protein
MYNSKGIALILSFISMTGLLGLDKFYTKNYILGSIKAILTLSYVTMPITIIWNLITILALIILIFTNFNLLIYTKFGETTKFDYLVATTISLYFICKIYYIYSKYNEKEKHNK